SSADSPEIHCDAPISPNSSRASPRADGQEFAILYCDLCNDDAGRMFANSMYIRGHPGGERAGGRTELSKNGGEWRCRSSPEPGVVRADGNFLYSQHAAHRTRGLDGLRENDH